MIFARTLNNQPTMMPKYKIEFSAGSASHPQAFVHHYETDDPVTCEQHVADLLELRCKLRTIKHDGVELPRKEFDRVVKNALGMLAARHVCGSLGIDSDEAHVRFGTPA
jgi:hypothetical protein